MPWQTARDPPHLKTQTTRRSRLSSASFILRLTSVRRLTSVESLHHVLLKATLAALAALGAGGIDEPCTLQNCNSVRSRGPVPMEKRFGCGSRAYKPHGHRFEYRTCIHSIGCITGAQNYNLAVIELMFMRDLPQSSNCAQLAWYILSMVCEDRLQRRRPSV